MTRRALLSVYDKSGIVDFARGLAALGFELVSSGGTSKALAEAGVAHLSVEDVTGFPEMLDGRVKTLHPRIHGAILADRSVPEHMSTISEHSIVPIDLVACNLYPFSSDPSIELIDIGGPSMVRSAAKNHEHVAIIVDPAAYAEVLAELQSSGAQLSLETKRKLARTAFAHTSAYDSAIVDWFDREDEVAFPETLGFPVVKKDQLRYGENPHQAAARYTLAGQSSWWDSAVQHGGKEMSFLNVYDADAAWRLVHDLPDRPSVVIVKHANPCGVASARDIATAYKQAHRCDPVSAFGGVVAINRTVNLELAQALAPVFTEVVIAPGYAPDALALLSEKKNLRLLEGPAPQNGRFNVRSIDGGLLVQQPDNVAIEIAQRHGWRVVTERQPTESEWSDLDFAWAVCAHVSSNAIVLANDGQALGVGAGQQSRVDAAEIAVRKADGRASGGVCASDAFFPFRDGLDLVASAGVRAVIQPGGSVRDEEVIAAANEHGISMVFTGHRHFRH